MERKDTLTRHQLILSITQLSVLIGIEALICFTPLGTIQIGPIAATLAMVPVVITGSLLGPIKGGILGFLAGLFSFIVWTFIQPANPTAIMFTPWHTYGEISSYWTLLICFLPRTLTGVVAGYISILFKKTKFDYLGMILSGVLGSLTNTILVLLGTYFLWGHSYALASGIQYETLLYTIGSVILINGLPESAIAGILTPIVVKPLKTFLRSNEEKNQ